MRRAGLVLLLLSLAGAARAEGAAQALNAAVIPGRASLAPHSADPLAAAADQAKALATAIRPTSVARRLSPDGLTGSAGFLCGLQPSRDTDGAMGAFGVDPAGKFLGAKLTVSF